MSRAVAVFALLIAVGALSFAGPLSPPAGPVAPTMKTLDEVEPRIAVNAENTPGNSSAVYLINEPGSYYLTGNIIGEPGKSGIAITTDGVTLDLSGYSLIGQPGALSGVKMAGLVRRGITVRNGIVQDWPELGLELVADNTRIEYIQAHDNIQGGISNNFSTFNTIVSYCQAYSNGTAEVPGFGISVGNGSVVTNCVAYRNTDDGFRTNVASVLSDCTAQANNGAGYDLGPSAVVRSCVSARNTGAGFHLTTASHIEGCAAESNDGSGIVCRDSNKIVNNNIDKNGTTSADAGILVTASDNLLVDNHSTDNRVGFLVTSSGNILRGNSSSGNAANWSVVAGNRLSVVNSPSAGAVTANSGGVPLSNDPHVNFTY